MKFQKIQKLRNFENTDKFKAKLGWPREAMIKYDGRHTTIIKHTNGDVEYYTSGGKVFELLDDQVFGLSSTPVGVYFAEMMGVSRTALVKDEFKSLPVEGKLGDRKYSGIQTTMFTNTKKSLFNRQKPNWKVFDYVTIADYDVGICELPFVARMAFLKEHIPNSFIAFNMECLNYEHLSMFHSKATAEGWEGTVSIEHSQQWQAKSSRPHTQIKLKEKQTADLIVVGETDGVGKYTGMIGSLTCADGAGHIVCNVGSGLTDYDREQWGSFMGKIVEVQYEQIMDKKLIQPIFKMVRDDKSEAEVIKL